MRQKLCLLIIMFVPAFCCQIPASAQQHRIDSLRSALPALTGTKQADALNRLSEANRDARKFHAARTYALQAATLANELNYLPGKGEAYYNLSQTGFELRDFSAVESDCDTAIAAFKQLGNKRQLARAYILSGQAIWAQSKFDKAQIAFGEAEKLFTQVGDLASKAGTISAMALLEEERGNYERSFQYAIKALKYARGNDNAYMALGQLYADVGDYETAFDYYNKIKSRDARVYAYLKVGEAHFLQNHNDSAIYYYRRFIKDGGGIARKLLPKPYALLGSVYLKQKDYKAALYYLHTALKDFKAENNRNWIMRVLLELGKTYKEAGEPGTAIKYTRELLASAELSGARQYTLDGNYLLYQLYDAGQQKDSAYVHLKKYTALKRLIDIDLSARKLAFYKSSREREQSQLKIGLLDKQRQLQQEELKQAAQEKRFLFIGLLAIAVIGTVVMRNIWLKRLNEKHLRELAENELHIQKLETKKQLSELEMQVLRTQMNPHFLFNSLNSINRFILRNNSAEASGYLTKFSRLVRMILQNSQSKLITLEQELDSLQLYLSLEALRFDHHFSYKITVQDGLDISALKVPPLIIQPYTENAVWHGLMHKEEKGELHIEVLSENDALYLKITDDGVGREKACSLSQRPVPSHRPMGLGITSQRIEMIQEPNSQEAAVVINDLIDADGAPAGTEVTIKLPLIYG